MQGGAWMPHSAQPMFDGESYDYRSIKMKTLLISQDLQEIVEEGYEMKEKPEEDKEKKFEASVNVEEKENRKKKCEGSLFDLTIHL